MKKINIAISTSSLLLLSCTLLAVAIPRSPIVINDKTATTNNANSVIDIGDADNTMQSGATKKVTTEFNSGNTKDQPLFNHMRSMMPFLVGPEEHVYNVTNNTNGGLIVYDNSYNIVRSFNSSVLTPPSGFTNFELIRDVAASSQGSYLYISALFSDPKIKGNVEGAIYKWDYKNNTMIHMADLRDPTPFTPPPGHVDRHNNRYQPDSFNIEVVPGADESKDKILGFYSSFDTSDGGGDTMPVFQYFSINPSIVDVTKITTLNLNLDNFMKFPASSTKITNKKRLLDAKVINLGSNKYQLIMLSRGYSYQDGDYTAVFVSKFNFTLDASTGEIKPDRATATTDKWNNIWIASNYCTDTYNVLISTDTISMQAKDINSVNINFMNAAFSRLNPNIPGTSLIGSYTFDYKASTWSKANAKNFIIEKTNTKNIIEQDVAADGKNSFECYPNNNYITTQGPNFNPKDPKFINLVALTDQLEDGYHLFDTKQTIKGFSWADDAKTKMAIYDSNGMVTQYDTTNQKFSLIHGVEFKDGKEAPKHLSNKMPSQLTDSDLKTLIKPVGLPSKNVEMSKITDDDNGNLTVKIEVKDNNGDVLYKYSKQYTSFATYFKKVTEPIIIGVTVGIVVLLIVIITTSVILYKKKNLQKKSHPSSGRGGRGGRVNVSTRNSTKKSAPKRRR